MLTILHNARKKILAGKDVKSVSDLCRQYFREALANGLAGPKEPYRAILGNRIYAKMLAAYFYGGIHGALRVTLPCGAFTIERFNVVNVALLRDETALMPLEAVMDLLGSEPLALDRGKSEFLCEIMVRDLELDRAVHDYYEEGSNWMMAFLEGKQELPMSPHLATSISDLFGGPQDYAL